MKHTITEDEIYMRIVNLASTAGPNPKTLDAFVYFKFNTVYCINAKSLNYPKTVKSLNKAIEFYNSIDNTKKS